MPANDDQLQAAGPRGSTVSLAPCVRWNGRDAGRLQGVQDRVGDGRVLGLVPAPERDSRRSEGAETHLDSVPVPAQERRRPDLGERGADPPRPPADDRERLVDGAGDGDVTSPDDRRLLARDLRDRVAQPGHMVQRHVRDRGDAAVPGVGGVEPPAESDLDESDLDPLLGEPAEQHRGQELELSRLAVSPGDTIGNGEHLAREARERHRVDRPSVDLQPLPVRDQVGLRRRSRADPGGAQRAPGQRENAALAVCSADEGAAQLELRITERMQEAACSTQAQANPEPTTIGQRLDCRVVLGCRPGASRAAAWVGEPGGLNARSAPPRRTRTG